MTETQLQRHRQRTIVHSVMLFFSFILTLLQIWLFTATLENLLAHKPAMALPAALVSIVCCGINVWMLIGLFRLDTPED